VSPSAGVRTWRGPLVFKAVPPQLLGGEQAAAWQQLCGGQSVPRTYRVPALGAGVYDQFVCPADRLVLVV